MKFLKGFGGALCFIGCLAALTGILATAAPMMDNDQVRRILESFTVPTRDVVLQTVNNLFLLCLKQNYWVFGLGIGVLLLGGLMRMYAERTLLAGVVAEEHAPGHRARVTYTQPSRVSPTKAPAATVSPTEPLPPSKPVELSPYTAAAYGNALSGHAYGSGSAIADKYMPRSIINTPEPEDDPAVAYRPATVAEPLEKTSDTAQEQPLYRPQTPAEAWSTPKPAVADDHPFDVTEKLYPSSAQPQTDAPQPIGGHGSQICPDCGATCDAGSLYCPTCGCRLVKPAGENFQPSQKPVDAAATKPVNVPMPQESPDRFYLQTPAPETPVQRAQAYVSAPPDDAAPSAPAPAVRPAPTVPIPTVPLSMSQGFSDRISPAPAIPYEATVSRTDNPPLPQNPRTSANIPAFTTVDAPAEPAHTRIVSTVRTMVADAEPGTAASYMPMETANPAAVVDHPALGSTRVPTDSDSPMSAHLPQSPSPGLGWESVATPTVWQHAEPTLPTSQPVPMVLPANAPGVPIAATEPLSTAGFAMQGASPAENPELPVTPASPPVAPAAPRPRIVSTMRKKTP